MYSIENIKIFLFFLKRMERVEIGLGFKLLILKVYLVLFVYLMLE